MVNAIMPKNYKSTLCVFVYLFVCGVWTPSVPTKIGYFFIPMAEL